ncbi:formylglycine-generating enzyme family protein [Nostocales cyanobacterium LEGE 11386]|nr:formylglycine-generating enzyme family protein [Nostocales cyanobacterium LEGE 11386]
MEVLTTNTKLEMVEIPPGIFMMGSPGNDLTSNNDEQPQHEVKIERFLMGKYLVTQKQWEKVAIFFPAITKKLNPKPSFFKGSNHPVEQISWYDANEFCARLSKEIGKNYRLPTEAEWEYACRAGTTTSFYFGETITPKLANYNSKYVYTNQNWEYFRQQTTPVGSFPPNAFGLHDMSGNVWEWCIDTWHDNYNDAPINGAAWVDSNPFRLLRGGSWYSHSVSCRSAYRHRFSPKSKYEDVGFRVVCDDVKAFYFPS